MDAFWFLCDSRPRGEDGARIQIKEMESYLNIYGVNSVDDRTTFIMFIRRMDNTFLEALKSKRHKPVEETK